MRNPNLSPSEFTAFAEQDDTASPERLEALESVAGEMVRQVRRHLPESFTVGHRVADTSDGYVILNVQTPLGPMMEVTVPASEFDVPLPSPDDGGSDSESVESVSVEITAAVVKQMRQIGDAEQIKARPAS